MKNQIWSRIIALLILAIWLTGCAPAVQTSAPAAPAVPAAPAAPQAVPAATSVPAAANPSEQNASTQEKLNHQATQAPIVPAAVLNTPTVSKPGSRPGTPGGQENQPAPILEQRMLEMEYPLEIQLGESDLLRLALVPYQDDYQVTTEFPDHTVNTQTLNIKRPQGYILKGIARVDAAGFNISPQGDQESLLAPGETATWRWSLEPRSAGRQRLSMSLWLCWEPEAGRDGPSRQVQAFTHGLEISVSSILGLTRLQAILSGFSGLFIGALFSLTALAGGRRQPRRFKWTELWENPRVLLEPFPGLILGASETGLLRALFNRYQRLVIENEFLSGYSGARTFLIRPIGIDGQADAATIVKMGPRRTIQSEFENYEKFVKDRLPPLTARIQQPPVSIKNNLSAALQYTFIEEPGRRPISLRQALLSQPDPDLLLRLFESFGPSWWMQRQPAIFRWGEEYDRVFPPHAVLEACDPGIKPLINVKENSLPAQLDLAVGASVWLYPFEDYDSRADGRSLTLKGIPQPGEAALRLRWSSPVAPQRPTRAVVTALRSDLLAGLTHGLSLEGLPSPIDKVPGLFYRSVSATRSVIHGDLNLENVLVGPGGFVWLIDFGHTRIGHPLFDFAHLQAGIISHVMTPRGVSPKAYLHLLETGSDPLLFAVETITKKLLFNPSAIDEYYTALGLTCLGALKYASSTPEARQLLYLTAAFYLQ